MTQDLNERLKASLADLEALRRHAADRPDLTPHIDAALGNLRGLVALTAETEPRNGLTIVIAEDDALVRMTMAGLLEEMGHVVVEAATAQEALEALARGADILMSDLHLPGMTGVALVEEALVRQPGLAVVIASGDPPGESRHVWLQKPFSSTRLRAAVKAAIAAA